MVSAWGTANGAVFGQAATDEKSNEIIAIPELLKALKLKGLIVTIDAIAACGESAATPKPSPLPQDPCQVGSRRAAVSQRRYGQRRRRRHAGVACLVQVRSTRAVGDKTSTGCRYA